jgi:beta-glucosidase
MAVAYIEGVQSQGVGACIKHFVCNDSEFERKTISSEVRERALREIYLPPFKAAIEEVEPWAVMSAYNKINGTWASENPYTLLEILKGDWGFEGFVVSDWWGTNSTVPAANGGLDIEMPGPPLYMGDKLLKAVRQGQVSEQVIDDKVRRILRIMIKAGVFENPDAASERAVDRPEHRELAREAAAEGMVLLKNERDLLPLDDQKIQSIAVIGPNANVARFRGGGSSRVNPHYIVTPLEGITRRCGDAVQVSYEQGCTNHRRIPVLDNQYVNSSGDKILSGFTGEYYNNLDLSGEPVHMGTANALHMEFSGDIYSYIDEDEFSVRWTGVITAHITGAYTFSLSSAGLSRLALDDALVMDNWTAQARGEEAAGAGRKETTAQVDLAEGRSYDVKVEYSSENTLSHRWLRVGFMHPLPDDAMERAAAIAADSDVALVFVGTSEEWESEGFDRADMKLPGDQDELVRKVAAANPNTVVVLNNGSPLEMGSWIDRVPAVLEAWFPGQECGTAMADILFGEVNPSGKLSTTFPKRLEDNPAYINYPGENGMVLYGEGLFVGYRYYDKKDVVPLFPFGHGLSYTTFEYGELEMDSNEVRPGGEVRVTVEVHNTGEREGREVVQLYVRDVESSLVRPEMELKGFKKVNLKPGGSERVSFTLTRKSLCFYDPSSRQWIAEPGEFEVLVGSSSRDIRTRGSFWMVDSSQAEK